MRKIAKPPLPVEVEDAVQAVGVVPAEALAQVPEQAAARAVELPVAARLLIWNLEKIGRRLLVDAAHRQFMRST